MAKFELKFIDASDTMYVDVNKIKINVSNKDMHLIEINIYGIDGKSKNWIRLDKSTAIKFAKTLRTEINKITESEVSNV